VWPRLLVVSETEGSAERQYDKEARRNVRLPRRLTFRKVVLSYCVGGSGQSDSPPGRHHQGLQAGMGGQGHRCPDRPARPRRHGHRRRGWPRHYLPAPHRRRRADRARLGRNRQPLAQQRGLARAHRQRSARAGGSARRRHRDSVRVRRRRRPDQAHLGHPQPRQAPALDGGLTRVAPAVTYATQVALVSSCPEIMAADASGWTERRRTVRQRPASKPRPPDGRRMPCRRPSPRR
jgi:hypothetical protein